MQPGTFNELTARFARSLTICIRGSREMWPRPMATSPRLPKQIAISTDPPYYDNIGYADLSDYFYVWLRKSVGSIYPSLFVTMLTPKSRRVDCLLISP